MRILMAPGPLDPGDPVEIRLAEELGSGGEGVVYAVRGLPSIVAKLYYDPSPGYAHRLGALLEVPPEAWIDGDHLMLAWPAFRLLDAAADNVVGHVMYRLPSKRAASLGTLMYADTRHRRFGEVSWRYLVEVAQDLARLIDRLHQEGYVVGDLKHDNILVSPGTGRVTLIDCLSMQFRDDRTGELFPSPVTSPEYAAPELSGKDLDSYVRSPHSDAFSLAIVICRLLMEGEHPFYGVVKNLPDEVEQSIQSNIVSQHTRYLFPERLKVDPDRVLPLDFLPPPLLSLALQCFGEGHAQPDHRPSASQWVAALAATNREAVACAANPRHAYHPGLPACPWCALAPWRDPYGDLRALPRPAPRSTPARAPAPAPASASGSDVLAKILIAVAVALVALIILAVKAAGG
jgi:DNA-binding helix-hairpin-helix protein with protein kinase domain